MRYGAIFAWGVVIYAVMFLLWSGFALYGFTLGIAPTLIGLLTLIVVALIAGRSLRYHSWRDILPYSAAWTLEVALLDIVFSVPFTGWALFADWNVWVGYSLILLVPLFAPILHRVSASAAIVDHHEE